MLRQSSLFERCVFRILFFGLLLFNPYLLLEFGCEEEAAMDSTYFISHGSPTLAIDEDLPARHFLMNWKKILPQKPQAILVISAHWDTRYPSVTTVERHNTIHDFYGFPQEMYKIKYDAVGAPELARTVKKCLLNGGFKNVTEDSSRGLDHGAWVPLHLMYPSADIPVCQLSVQSHLGPEYHFKLGRTLAPLKSQGILIIGSGSATHNLQTLAFHNPSPPRWAKDFDAWLTESLHNGRYDEIIEYKNKAPSATIAHPYPEHFYPLHVALGAAGEAAKAELIHTSWSLGTISYSSYAFKSA